MCNGEHPTTLHGYVRRKVDNAQHQCNSEASEERKDGEVAACVSLNTGMEVIIMCVVPVKLRHGDSGKTLKTYALLDSCSQGTFILERLPKRFGIKGRRTSITIKTLNGEVTNKSSVISGMKVASSRDSSEDWLELPDTYTKKYLPVGKEDVATPSKLKNWGHLERILDEINEDDNISVGLLIRANCTKALEPIDVIPSKNNGPYAIKTRLGWCIVSPVNGTQSRQGIHCNRIAVKQADTKDVGKHYFQTKTSVEENDVRDMLTRLYNLEFTENGPTEGKLETSMSREDQKFMKILQEGTTLRNGHYQVPLPFKEPYVNLPNNRYQAMQRFSYLEKKFSKNDQFKEDYIRFMKDIIAKGYARKSTTEAASGKTWYLPHHGVYHPNKPGKIRVVFDLSADYKGRCLNRELLSGRDLTNQIVRVLLGF